jgi:hypothetical protein
MEALRCGTIPLYRSFGRPHVSARSNCIRRTSTSHCAWVYRLPELRGSDSISLGSSDTCRFDPATNGRSPYVYCHLKIELDCIHLAVIQAALNARCAVVYFALIKSLDNYVYTRGLRVATSEWRILSAGKNNRLPQTLRVVMPLDTGIDPCDLGRHTIGCQAALTCVLVYMWLTTKNCVFTSSATRPFNRVVLRMSVKLMFRQWNSRILSQLNIFYRPWGPAAAHQTNNIR